MKTESTRLELAGISASYGGTPVLQGLSLEVNPGELAALLGPSGSGKTTILRIVAGLLRPDAGSVRFNGEAMDRTPAEKRGAAVVLQKPLLFPHMTVAENVSFGLRMRRTPAPEQAERVREALEMVRLEGYESRLPRELSGGQEQRVALARALVISPRILLLDEPFSALDEGLRGEMRSLVRGLQRRLGATTVFVTHDQAEASVMADRIALLLDGAIVQYTAPREFYTEPKTLRAARFFGWQTAPDTRAGYVAAYRPESVRLAPVGEAQPERWRTLAAGRVAECTDLGTRVRIGVELDGSGRLTLERPPAEAIVKAGELVQVSAPEELIRVFPTKDG